jgi:hypothetical protein
MLCRSRPATPSPQGVAVPLLVPSVLDDGPCMELVRVNGFTGEYTNAMAPAPSGKEAFFIAANNLVAMDIKTFKQRFFHGHTANITAFAFSGEIQTAMMMLDGSSLPLYCL